MLVRHGVTEWNAQRRFQGHTDLPLTEEGRGQAARLAKLLARKRVDRVYTSDLTRAVETARAIAAPHGLETIGDARLREFSFGDWEGLTWAEILASQPDLGTKSYRSADLYAPSGGESFDDVCARVRPFYADVIATGLQHVVVVAHAGVLHATLRVLGLGRSERDGPIDFLPASVTRIARERDAWRLIDGPTVAR